RHDDADLCAERARRARNAGRGRNGRVPQAAGHSNSGRRGNPVMWMREMGADPMIDVGLDAPASSDRRRGALWSAGPRCMRGPGLFVLVAILALGGCGTATLDDTVEPAAGYEEVAAALERLIRHEMADKDLPAISFALVDDKEIVWAQGFGEARPGIPATAATVHRVGSVSK